MERKSSTGNLDELGADPLVLVAVGAEDVERGDDRVAEQLPDIAQADLVGDVGEELLAADLVAEPADRARRRARGSSGRRSICLSHSRPISGSAGMPSRSASCWRIRASTRSRCFSPPKNSRAHELGQAGDEHVRPVPLAGQLVELAAVDRLAVEIDDLLVPPAVVGAEQPRQAVGDDETEHGQDREDGEQLALMAAKDLERHGVPQMLARQAVGGWFHAPPP